MKTIYFFIWPLVLIVAACSNTSSSSVDRNDTTMVESYSTTVAPPILTASDYFIKKYDGTINGQFPIEFLLINWGDGQLMGYYSYAKIGKNIELDGELNLNETFTIQEYANDKNTGTFVGSLENLKHITGNWINPDSSSIMPFELNERKFVPDPSGWTGAWHFNHAKDDGILIIGNVADDSFDFALKVYRNGHFAYKIDRANFEKAVATSDSQTSYSEDNCRLTFTRKQKRIRIDQEGDNMACGFGARANVDGDYDDEIILQNTKEQ